MGLNIQIGQRIKALRVERKLSQQKLAGILKLSFQQIQKYERGASRISAERLYEISEFFNVPITFFYHDKRVLRSLKQFEIMNEFPSLGMREEQAPFSYDDEDISDEEEADYTAGKQGEQHFVERANLNYEETRNLLSAYYRIQDSDVRKHILSLIENLGNVSSEKS